MKKYYNKLFLNNIRKAVDEHNLIVNGDNILVGLSGGKDSIFLLYSLILLKNKSFIDFNIIAAHIDIGFKIELSNIEDFCRKNDIEFHYKSIDVLNKIENSNKSPCYICSKYKRGAMATLAKELQINKIAYGHHLTDLINTYYLNIIKNNNFNIFKALTYNEKHDISLIRPLIYIEEDIIVKILEEEQLPLANSGNCPYENLNERKKINKLILESKKIYPDFENHLLKSFKNTGLI